MSDAFLTLQRSQGLPRSMLHFLFLPNLRDNNLSCAYEFTSGFEFCWPFGRRVKYSHELYDLCNAPWLRWLAAGFPPRRPGFEPGSDHVRFVVDKVALGQVSSEYFGFPCQSSYHQLLHKHPHLSSGAGTIGQKWPQYQVDSVSPH
jgi:hypothetical protein